MSAICLSCIVLIMLGNIPFTPSFFRDFMMKRCWILPKPFIYFFLFLLLFICAYKTWFISPPAPTPSLTTHSALSLPPPQYPAETILPLFLILL
jgi:hypothetical protein